MENYVTLSSGIIKQINVQKITYNSEYNEKYNRYGEKGNYLSYLRLGVLLGALGRRPESIVDVGFGNGDFLRACVKSIKHVFGCDISDYPTPEGATKIELKDISNADVVCFFDSLEHFDNIDFIKDLDTKYIFISVPWCHNISEEWFLNWYHRRENEHLYHFNEESLKQFFSNSGYECIFTHNFEDIIRVNPSVAPLPNILSCIFKKI
jgi:hypothetical protein